MAGTRDEFTSALKDVLAKRAGNKCSNPGCEKGTFGPHTDTAKAVNIGVAAHIAAASPGGPRYDSALTSEQRTSMDNALWLCQVCAKLIDSDTQRYSLSVLRIWKITAESAARLELEQRFVPSHTQVIAGRQHAAIPAIWNQDYDQARQMLIDVGWQPILQRPHEMNDAVIAYGNGKHYWDKGYWELRYASSTGLAHCRFDFQDIYGNRLAVVTAGEIQSPSDSAGVCRWFFADEPEE